MNREQALKIQEHALEASAAISKIEEIALGFAKEERSRLADHLGSIRETLHFEILREVYDRFPDLRVGHEEPPEMSSWLRWGDVSLPAGVSEGDLDDLILAVLTVRWQKTAMVIGKTRDQCEARAIPIDSEAIGARIVALAQLRRIESAGNPAMWRHSEVRLKPG
jgi:hypothetical protein